MSAGDLTPGEEEELRRKLRAMGYRRLLRTAEIAVDIVNERKDGLERLTAIKREA